MVNGVFKKRKVRLCVMGKQREQGVHYQLGELYAPVMKAAEVRLFMAIAAKYGLNLFKSDTKQAFLNGDIGKEKLFVRAPDWWPDSRACPAWMRAAADEEHVRYSTSSSTVACEDINMDRRAWVYGSE